MADYHDDFFHGIPMLPYEFGTELRGVRLCPGQTTLIGGRTGTGKSALAEQMITQLAMTNPEAKAVVCNVDLSYTELIDRNLARIAGVSATDITTRQWRHNEADRQRVEHAWETLGTIGDRITYVECGVGTASLVRIVEAIRDTEANVVVLDYLQRMTPNPKKPYPDKRSEIDELLRVCRQLASNGIALLLVSSLNRAEYKTMGQAAFKESGELEYSCNDGYLLIPKIRKQVDTSKDRNWWEDEIADQWETEYDAERRYYFQRALLKHVKHRHTQAIHVPLRYVGKCLKWTTTRSV